MNNENDNATIRDLKLDLYAVIEQGAVLQAEFNRLEQIKGDLAKKLGEARKAHAETKAE